jgi:hypothetical protein
MHAGSCLCGASLFRDEKGDYCDITDDMPHNRR